MFVHYITEITTSEAGIVFKKRLSRNVESRAAPCREPGRGPTNSAAATISLGVLDSKRRSDGGEFFIYKNTTKMCCLEGVENVVIRHDVRKGNIH